MLVQGLGSFVLGYIRVMLGLWGLYKGSIRVILGLYWGYIGIILGFYWGYIGVFLGLRIQGVFFSSFNVDFLRARSVPYAEIPRISVPKAQY